MSERYKLIIVDDEYLVRKGLRCTVDWESLGIDVVGEYENGKQALEAVDKFRPDLIVSDVRMPVMDGLELAERLFANQFDGAVIFYSGFSDFEYVRKALEYGVSGYVLKPIENKKLIEKVKESIVALNERRKKRDAFISLTSGGNYVKETYFRKLDEGVDDGALRDQLSVLNIFLPAEGLVLYGRSLRVEDSVFGTVYEELMRSLENFNAVGYLWDDTFIIVTGLTDRDTLCVCAEKLLGKLYENTVFASIGISAFGKGILLNEGAIQAKKAAKPALKLGGVYTAGKGVYKEGGVRKLIEDALDLMHEHYAEKITVKWVADKLFVSESHLMHEFKVELGQTFNDCLRHYRIEKAKELLKLSNMRVNEIAVAVGFSDGRYFAQVFKEYVGKTPSEYQEYINEDK